MTLLRRILLAALLGGALAGVFAAVLHQFATVPLILEAETYELAAEHAAPHTAPAPSPAAADHHHAHGDAWAPEEGAERVAYTLAADMLVGIGFALLLAAGMVLRGGEIAWRKGLLWGLAGFLAFTVAPGLGLPPDLPGNDAGPLLARQLWWAATAVMTAGALALLAFTRHKLTAVAAVALLALPHLYGAPPLPSEEGAAPASLARQFIVTATVASLLFWAALGAATGYFYGRFGHRGA
ncbi:MAG: CbtA family protein [Alphaproteobacteria bacterium]